MDIRVDAKDDWAEVSPLGDLVASTVEELRTQFAALAERQVNRILLNLWGVNFIDSTGLNACIEAHKQFLNRSGRIIFVSPSEAVRKVFKMTGAYQKLIMASTREEGIKRLHDDGV